jgi:hypothetical protein
MGRALALLLVLPALARAEGTQVTTSSAHELVWAPPSGTPIRGPRFALITVDVYATFNHATSNRAAELGRSALAHGRPGELRVLLHLSPFGPAGADLAAEAALEAEAQGRFDAFVDRYLIQRGAPALTVQELTRVGREIGLDADKLNEALAARTWRSTAEKLGHEARAASRMPGEVLLNGRRISPYTADEQLLIALREARQRAEAVRESGVPLSQVYERLLENEQDESRRDSFVFVHRPRRIHWPEELSPVRGPALAPLTLVIYSNLQCGPCLDLHLTARRLRERFPGRIREVWKHWVPKSTGGPEIYAAELAATAADQGKLFNLLDVVLALQQRSQRASRSELDQAVQQVGLNLERMARYQREGRLRAFIERDSTDARPAELSYGPLMLLNGQVITSGMAWDRVERLANEELSRSLKDRLGDRPPGVR